MNSIRRKSNLLRMCKFCGKSGNMRKYDPYFIKKVLKDKFPKVNLELTTLEQTIRVCVKCRYKYGIANRDIRKYKKDRRNYLKRKVKQNEST